MSSDQGVPTEKVLTKPCPSCGGVMRRLKVVRLGVEHHWFVCENTNCGKWEPTMADWLKEGGEA